MLAFTPAVEDALSWFDATYELAGTTTGVWYRRWCLPGPGGIGDQDELLMQALELLERVHNDLLRLPQTERPEHDA